MAPTPQYSAEPLAYPPNAALTQLPVKKTHSGIVSQIVPSERESVPKPVSPSFPEHVYRPTSVPKQLGLSDAADGLWLRAASLRQPHPVVGVASADGGVGRSTIVAAVGSVVAYACPNPVAVLDLAQRGWSGLEHRVHKRSTVSPQDAVESHADVTHHRVADTLMQLAPADLRVLLPERTHGGQPSRVLFDDSSPFLEDLRVAYAMLLLDLPSADSEEMWQGLVAATAPLLVCRAQTESIQHTLRVVARLRRMPAYASVADRCVVAVNETTPHVDRKVKAAEHTLAGQVAAVQRIPYDKGLAASGPIEPVTLSRATRRAVVSLAASVLEQCPADPNFAAALAATPPHHDGSSGGRS